MLSGNLTDFVITDLNPDVKTSHMNEESVFTYSQLLALAEKSARKSISSDLIKYSDDILRG